MRHIYNGEEGDFTDLTIVAPAAEPGATSGTGAISGTSGATAQPAAAANSAVAANLAALPPRSVFSYLTQNMCVGESRW